MIACFRRHPRWSLGGLAAAIILAVATLTGAQTKSNSASDTVNLAGTVQATNGQPVSATVYIYTAGPKTGTSTLCPSCYADCRKSAKTDKQGHFKIESLDPQLLFRLLVISKNCQPAFVTGVDPAKDPVRVTLQPQDLSHYPPNQTVRGRVVDNQGAPIKRATIEGLLVHFHDGTMGPRTDLDPVAVTDDRGQFVLTARRPVDSLNLTVEAPGYAKRTFADVSAANSQVLQLTEGAMVKGRVMEDGKPLPNVSVGIVSEDRTPGNFRFSLPSQLGMKMVAACVPAGCKIVSVDSLATNRQIILEPWSKVTGTLRQAGKPWTNKKIYLSEGGAYKESGVPMFIQMVTDDKGRFEFDFAPAIDCQIMASAPAEDSPGRLITIKEFHIGPGQTVPLDIDAPVQPVVDVSRVRQRLQSFGELPSQSLQGRVVLPDGKPAAGVQVGIADGRHNLEIGDGELVAGPMNPNVARTGKDGVFNVPWPASATALYAASEAGVALLKSGGWTNGMQVKLQPWARVEGTIRLNQRPAVGQRINLYSVVSDSWTGGMAFHVNTTSDANGHFAVDHVLPGSCSLGRWVNSGPNSQTTTGNFQFELAPGQATNILRGSNGRPVTGTLDLRFAKDVPTNADFTVSIHTAYPLPPGDPRSTGLAEIDK